MTKHKGYIIERDNHWFGFEAVHQNYEADQIDGTWHGSHPVFHGDTVQDCIEQIDEWYGDQDG